MLKVSRFVFNMFGVNTYVVWDPATLEGAVIDPGMIEPRECQALDRFVESKGIKLTSLINTHMHLDHVFGDGYVADKYGLKVRAAAADDFLGRNLEGQARMFGLALGVESRGRDVELRDGDTVRVGSDALEVIAVPGHSPGSIALLSAGSKFVITGDALFKGSIGRTDLPGGDFNTLAASIRSRLLTLPDDTAVLPGHGDETTIGWERAHNYMIR